MCFKEGIASPKVFFIFFPSLLWRFSLVDLDDHQQSNKTMTQNIQRIMHET
ncbi:hypothetical protein CIPAW_15G013100 [Carya illinoinensis]|uniref:Uncharacterized protein n=1 Tax=Carya illinoinensis TaxID=32201 RepID=A0A8T1N7W8_CARIL|nr:hypothetical protein CIPAW_15G013100 [Carya illinoinensis]